MVDSNMRIVEGTPFVYDRALDDLLRNLSDRVIAMRGVGKLSPESLRHLARLFRIKNIYHSNAIEGNQLNHGETKLVVEQGLTITGKSLKDQAEAKNLAQALDFLEDLASGETPILQVDIRQIHKLILANINDEEAGKFRSVEVKISGSSYTPPGPEKVGPDMTEFSDWLNSVSQNPGTIDPIVLSAVAHAWFAQIHPFVDGNGRTSRILMDLLLMRRGYPIAIITKEDRPRYYDALEESQTSDLSPLIHLIYESVEDSLEAYEQAAEEERKRGQWIAELAERFSAPERARLTNEYELWSKAMELFREHFRLITRELGSIAHGLYEVHFKDFGGIDLDKYLSLSTGQPVKRTWFFRIDFRRSDRSARYLFFFGYGSSSMRNKAPVSVHIAREDPQSSFNYVPLRELTAPNVPEIIEIGYDARAERFVLNRRLGIPQEANVEAIAKNLVDRIVQLHFSQ